MALPVSKRWLESNIAQLVVIVRSACIVATLTKTKSHQNKKPNGG